MESPEYPKIQTLFLRDNHGKIVEGTYTLPEFEYLANNPWEFTEKVDGTNIRVGWDGGQVQVGGRTENASIPASLVQKLTEIFPGPDRFEAVFGEPPVCLYGEGYGTKIQKRGGQYKADGVDFVLFDVLVGGWWLRRPDVLDVSAKLGVSVVPVVGTGSLLEMIRLVRDGFTSQWGPFSAEGVVARPAVDLFSRKGERIITKLKQKDFR